MLIFPSAGFHILERYSNKIKSRLANLDHDDVKFEYYWAGTWFLKFASKYWVSGKFDLISREKMWQEGYSVISADAN